MKGETLRAIAWYLNRLPMVKWDRYIAGTYENSEDGYCIVYGWIEREDDRSDFVVVTVGLINPDDGAIDPEYVSATTSSASYSQEIQQLLKGTTEGHIDCIRVEDDFAGLIENVARAA